MKVGVIRCMQTRDYCASGRDFRTILGHKDAFANIDEDIEITGFVDCGGCPGKKPCCVPVCSSPKAPTPSLLHPASPKARPSAIHALLPKECVTLSPAMSVTTSASLTTPTKPHQNNKSLFPQGGM